VSDPNTFTKSLATIIDFLEDQVRNGVEQPQSHAAIYKSSIASYELPRPAVAVTEVTGLRGGRFVVFRPQTDYRFSTSRIGWLDGDRPDESSRFDIEFTYREEPSGLTDLNPGSVIGTILRAAAREMAQLYAQMDEVYRRALIDHATGVALDNVVALLGVKRTPALKATGKVTFARKKAPTETLTIARGTRVGDRSGRLFATTKEGRIPFSPVDEIALPAGRVVKTASDIATVSGVWRRGDDPAATPPIAIAAAFGDDERTITFTGDAPAGEVLVRYQPKSVTIGIEAMEPGPAGNVSAASITLMPTPPRGIDAVANALPTDGGLDAEPDDRLRERAKHALERAGNATTNAIKYAVLGVKGVQDVQVLDFAADPSIPLGEVRVRYSGGSAGEVRAAVEGARAAGVLARVEPVLTVQVSGLFCLIPGMPPAPGAGAKFLAAVVDLMDKLAIGEPLALRRLNALAYAIPGLAEVAEPQLDWKKPDPDRPGQMLTGPVRDPLLASASELIRPDRNALGSTMLSALRAPAHRSVTAGKVYEIELNLLAGGDVPVSFRGLSLEIRITARAALKSHPTQPPEQVGAIVKTTVFTGATAKLAIDIAADLKGYRPADHTGRIELTLAAAAYPGLDAATRSIDVTG
jgi:uncharacterized phage protein gp47/JayE